MIVEIENLTKAQELALESMFASFKNLGGIGASRWVSFFADGDGNFHPKIKVNGIEPKEYKNKNGEYVFTEVDRVIKIDYDKIAWEINYD